MHLGGILPIQNSVVTQPYSLLTVADIMWPCLQLVFALQQQLNTVCFCTCFIL